MEDERMAKWVCPVCGYVHEGDESPAECPVCHVSGSKFTKMEGSGSKHDDLVMALAIYAGSLDDRMLLGRPTTQWTII